MTTTLEQQPEVKAIRSRIAEVDFDGVSMAFDVDVQNPYSVPVRNPRVRYTLAFQDSREINSETVLPDKLPPGSVSTVTLPVHLSYADILRDSPALSQATKADFNLNGLVILPMSGQSPQLPFEFAGAFPIARRLSISTAKVQLADVSLTKATVIVDADIENPNGFAVDMRDVTYSLDLGQVQVGGLTSPTRKIGAGKRERVNLIGHITAEEGLIKILMNGISAIPTVSATGSVGTPYGDITLAE